MPEKFNNLIFFVSVLQVLLFISGTVKLNPGPVSPQKKLSFAVWNLDSLPARDFARIPLIESLQNINDFDMFGVCESMLTSNILNEDIYINGFSPEPFRSDKGLNTRNGGVCLYFKESLPIKEKRDLEIIPETIVAEIKLIRKKIFVVLSYCHPNISIGEFNEYLNSLEKIHESRRKENSYGSILCGDFNAKSPLFWEGDSENRQGRLLNNFLISNNLEQLINEPTHVHDNGSQSCIDLICMDQPFLFTKTGVLSFLDHHSKHNIIHGTINISVPRPPPFKRNIWDYKSAKTDQIRADLRQVNWHELFFNLNVSEKCLLFTDVFLDIMRNHILNKIITCNYKDATWITPEIKTAINRNSRVYKKWVRRGRALGELDKVCEVRNVTSKFIRKAKSSYYSNLDLKLSDPNTGQKYFWTTYKKLINKKVKTNIPPLMENGVFISNCREKADIFNKYFANQCTINDNGSVLPNFISKTDASLSHLSVSQEQIINIINNFNPNKSHSHDGVSVSMLKIVLQRLPYPSN